MQSALAFLSIPLAVTESWVAADVQTGTSDSSFADAVFLSEGDIQPTDATASDALPALAWIGLPVPPVTVPLPSMAAGPEGELVAVDPADATAFVAGSLPEADIDAGNPVLSGPAASQAKGFTDRQVAPESGLADTAPKLLLAEDAPTRPLRPDATNPTQSTNPENPGLPTVPVVVAPVKTASQTSLPSSVEVSVQSKVTTLASLSGPVDGSDSVPDVSGDSLVRLAMEPLTAGSQPNSATPSQPKLHLEALAPDRPVLNETPGLVAGRADLQAPSQSADHRSNDRLASPASVQPPETLETTPAPAPGSFWERFFVDLDLQPGKPLPAALEPERDPASGLTKPVEATPVTPALPAVSGPGLAPPQATEILEKTEPSPTMQDRLSGPASQVMPKAKRPPGADQPAMASPPLVLVEDWTSSLGDQRGFVDSALPVSHPSGTGPMSSSLPSASSASAPSLPVPQVAAQLASVLLSSTDKATELALAPEELGRVRLRLEPDPANPDRLVILINVERPETLDLFRRHAGELAEAIRAAGYSGADIGFGQHGQGQGQDRQQPSDMFGIGKTSDDPGPTQPALRHATGANLDLRL